MKNSPLISVILPVYNAEKYLKACIESLLCQSFQNFELIVVDDASTDESIALVEAFDDSRILLVENEQNRGPAFRMNQGIALAKGSFIARMDADDLAMPQRLERQYTFFQQHPDYALLGTDMEFFGASNHWFPLKHYTYYDHESLKIRAFFYTPLAQPSIMARASIFQHFQYREDFYTAEDYHLFVRILDQYKASNLKEQLVRYRLHDQNISKLKKGETLARLAEVYALKFELEGIKIVEEDFKTHLLIPPANYSDLSFEEMKRIESWLLRLFDILIEEKGYDAEKLKAVFAEVWYRVGERAKVHGWKAYKAYKNSALFAYHQHYFRSPVSLLLRCIIAKIRALSRRTILSHV
ncbi:MAG: glycosyltransferase family A protein [Bacteroidota bacterium]